MILVIDCGSNKTRKIADLVNDFMDVKIIPLLDFKENDLTEIKGVIISGASLLISNTDLTKYLEKITWVKESKIPVLGINFGHQLIGILFGAEGNRTREDRDWQIIEAYEDSILFNRLPNEIRMMENHCETISIPPGFQLIASSDACINEVMEHHEKSS